MASAKAKGSPIDPTKVVEVSIKVKGKMVKSQCGPGGAGGAWVTGKMMKGNLFLSSKDETKDLKKQMKTASGKKLLSLEKRLAALKLIMKNLPGKCTLAGSTVESHSNPTVSDISGSASGLDPISLELPASAQQSGATVNCVAVNVPQNISVEFVSACGVLVHPTDHRTTSSNFTFKAIRNTDNHESSVATASVTWNQAGAFIGDSQSMAHYKDTLNSSEAKYLAYWLGADINQAVSTTSQPGGLDTFVNTLVTPSSNSSCSSDMAEALQLANYAKYQWCSYDSTLGICFYSSWNGAGRIMWNTQAIATVLMRMMKGGCNPLRERMALFWSNHFAVNNDNFSGSTDTRNDYVKEQLDLVRADIPEANGDIFLPFDKLVSQMHGNKGTFGASLDNYLNTFQSGGNENYGRELLERATMGVDDAVTHALNYNEQTVYNMRFALMGYYEANSSDTTYTVCCNTYPDYTSCPSWAGDCPICRGLPAQQQCVPKTKLKAMKGFSDSRWNFPGEPIGTMQFPDTPYQQYGVWKADVTRSGGDNLTSYVTNLPPVARYLAARFVGTFATTDITESVVAPIAAKLRDNQMNPREALRTIFTSSSFFSNTRSGIANPVETFMYYIKALGLPLENIMGTNAYGREYSRANLYSSIQASAAASGQSLFASPSVFGVDERGQINNRTMYNGEAFLSVQYLLERWKGMDNYLNYVQYAIGQGLSFSWNSLIPPSPTNRSPEAVLDYVIGKLPVDLTANERALLLQYLNTVNTSTMTEDGLLVPDPAYNFTINWADLPTSQFNELLSLKIPGLISLVFSLKGVHVR